MNCKSLNWLDQQQYMKSISEQAHEIEYGRSMVGKQCTLDGCPAIVVGRKNHFGRIMDDYGHSFEWSWESIGRIMDKGGNFKSN